MTVKELAKCFIINCKDHDVFAICQNTFLVTEESFNIQNLFLPYTLIFIFEKITHNSRLPSHIVYKIYDKISKFIVPDYFYDKLFNNQNDSVLQLLRARELFRLYQLTQDKGYLLKTFKYFVKKMQNQTHKGRIFKFKMLKSKILLTLGQPLEAYHEIMNYETLQTYKTLAYSDLDGAIIRLKKRQKTSNSHQEGGKAVSSGETEKENHKLFLLNIELQVRVTDNLAPGVLMSPDSSVNTSIVKQFLIYISKSQDIKVCYLRYLKYRNIKEAHRTVEDILKNKKQKIDEIILYETFIIKRKMKEISYRILYLDRSSDLMNQEICYIENKECENTNKFYYLFLYKKIRKTKIMTQDHIGYFLRGAIEGNGDCLLIMYILDCMSLYRLESLFMIYSINDGFYWCRTRKILNFKDRIIHTQDIFIFDQDY